MIKVELEDMFNINGFVRPYKVVGYLDDKPVIVIQRIDHLGLGAISPFWQVSASVNLPSNINQAKEHIDCLTQTYQLFEKVKREYFHE